jgi:hypothetical protein
MSSGPRNEGRVRRDAEERRDGLRYYEHRAAASKLRPRVVDGWQDRFGQHERTHAEPRYSIQEAIRVAAALEDM